MSMSVKRPSKTTIRVDGWSVRPVTAERWNDLVELFGERGACGGCWCMLWRLKRSVYEEGKGAPNKTKFRRLVKANRIPGLLVYDRRTPVGWCALAPREDYPALERSRILARIDAEDVWSISCLFVKRSHRKRGVSVVLLKAAVEHVRKSGGTIVEGYPHIPKKEVMPDAFAWTGIASAFEQAGFVLSARRSPARPVMRYRIDSNP